MGGGVGWGGGGSSSYGSQPFQYIPRGLTASCQVHIEEDNGPRHRPGASGRTPLPAVGEPSPMAACGPQCVHLWGHFPDGATQQPSTCSLWRSVPLVREGGGR